MRFRTWPVVAVALTGLLLVIVVSVLATSRKTAFIYGELEALTSNNRAVQARLHELRSNVLVMAILVRDYLLDTPRSREPEMRARIAGINRANRVALDSLGQQLGPDHAPRLATLEAQLGQYWAGVEPVFSWTPQRRITDGPAFLEQKARTTREAVISILEEVEQLNRESLMRQRATISTGEAELRRYLRQVFWISTSLGLLVAMAATLRIWTLERHADLQRRNARVAEQEMRQLSQRLVETQETERKTLSRELHDHVGQTLTALRMELGRAERTRDRPSVSTAALAEAKLLAENIMRTVRDLAMGLRPSMLDDLGLSPALDWLVRDFSRRSGIAVDLHVAGDLDRLPERYRICVYRVVQEALTNCARHAKATRITVRFDVGTSVVFSISDNGIGLLPHARRTGIGLVGIEERVRELGGTLTVDSGTRGGTRLLVEMPGPDIVEQEARVANLAG